MKITPDHSTMYIEVGLLLFWPHGPATATWILLLKFLVVHEKDAVSGTCAFLVDASEISGKLTSSTVGNFYLMIYKV